MSVANEAKYDTLHYIDSVGFATGKEIADHRGCTHGSQSTLLRRYWRFGLLDRFPGEGKTKIYTLTEKGYSRLLWLKEQFKQFPLNDNEVLHIKRCKVLKTPEVWELLKNLKRCRVIHEDNQYYTVERYKE